MELHTAFFGKEHLLCKDDIEIIVAGLGKIVIQQDRLFQFGNAFLLIRFGLVAQRGNLMLQIVAFAVDDIDCRTAHFVLLLFLLQQSGQERLLLLGFPETEQIEQDHKQQRAG